MLPAGPVCSSWCTACVPTCTARAYASPVCNPVPPAQASSMTNPAPHPTDPVPGSAKPLCSRWASPRARDLRAHRRSLEEGQPMTLMIDHEMEAVARQLWPSPQRLQLATGGLFNRVVQVQSPVGTTYLKRFTDAASSGDFPPLPTSASQRCLVASNWHELA